MIFTLEIVTALANFRRQKQDDVYLIKKACQTRYPAKNFTPILMSC